jgi:hypothetical protein
MTERDSFPDDVPVEDAVEQKRLVAEPADQDPTNLDDPTLIDDDVAPLEADESDWQEQHQVIEESDPDEFR